MQATPALRVLYVDDDRVNALLFAELCRVSGGISLMIAGGAEEALETLGGFDADVLVLDLHLRDGDGLTLLPRLRHRLGRPVPAYLCSADDPVHLEPRARAAGFDGCWGKPLDLQHVSAALHRHAGLTGGTQA